MKNNSYNNKVNFAKAFLAVIDSQNELTPEFTKAMRQINHYFMEVNDYDSISTDLDEYIGSLDDYISGQSDDSESPIGFRQSFEKCYLDEDRS